MADMPLSTVEAYLEQLYGRLDQATEGDLDSVAVDFINFVEPGRRDLISRSLPAKAEGLVHNRKPGAAVALEVCGHLELASSAPAFEAALENRAFHRLTQVIAAQRVRLLPIEDAELLGRLGRLVRDRVDGWLSEDDIDAVRCAIPSVPLLLRGEALPWLTRLVKGHLVHDDPQIVECAARAARLLAVNRSSLVPDSSLYKDCVEEFFRVASTHHLVRGPNPEQRSSDEWAAAELTEAIGAFAGWASSWSKGTPDRADEAALFLTERFVCGSAGEQAGATAGARHLLEACGERLPDVLRLALQSLSQTQSSKEGSSV
jgi:hypothetical protein